MAKDSALSTAFIAYQQFVLPNFAAVFPPKGTSFLHINMFESKGEKMLAEYDYTFERENFLIQKAEDFIKLHLDKTQSHNVSPLFLEKLANKIAEHLSYYLIYKYTIPTSGKSRNKLRLKVQQELKELLFDNSAYIAKLKQKAEANRAFRQKPRTERAKATRAKRQRVAYSVYCEQKQVNALFIEAQNIPRKVR